MMSEVLAPPVPPAHATPRTPRVNLVQLAERYALVGVWIVMAVVFWILSPTVFGSVGAFQSIFGSQQVLIFLTMSALVTLVVGEFDLSFAAVMGLTATIVVVLAGVHGASVWFACLVGIAAALLCGAVNAFFVVRMGISSFVVTLGMATLLLGLSQFLSGSSILALPDRGFGAIALTPVLGMPVSFWYGLLLVAGFAYVLTWTPLGHQMLIVGSNREVARLTGVAVDRVRTGAYLTGALLAACAGIVLVATVGGYDPAAAPNYLLPALAAVFLGTAVVQPGQFNPVGTLIGIFFLATGIFGLQVLGLSGWIQNVFYGGGLIIAVAVSQVIRQRRRRPAGQAAEAAK